MKLSAPQNFVLEVVVASSYRLSNGAGVCKFSAPASVRGIAKLYTVSAAGALIYVGVAEQPMSSRLNFGLKASGKGGYHGYKWKHLTNPLSLSLWTATVNGEPAKLRDLETVEAEVAFLCRHQSGQWPAYQHEIHFYQSSRHDHAAAERIYSHAVAQGG